MSFLKRLFGGGASAEAAVPASEPVEHKGFRIQATPMKVDGQFQCSGLITKEIDGETREHRFIRADKFMTMDDVVSVTLTKARRIIDEQGDNLFQR